MLDWRIANLHADWRFANLYADWRLANLPALTLPPALAVAAIHVIGGSLGEAQNMVAKALAVDPASQRALLVGVYLEMRLGNADAALRMLKSRGS